MVEMIEERQQLDNTNRHDLFTSLLRENKNVFESSMLTEDELIGEAKVILFSLRPTSECLFSRKCLRISCRWP